MVDGPGLFVEGDLERRLFALARQGMKLGLERMEPILDGLDHPERKFRSVHIAGTNGKGSTAAFCAHVLAQSGLRVGLFTSPHLVSLTERVRFLSPQGEHDVAREDLCRVVDRIEALDNGFASLTFFEVMTIAALMLFEEASIDVAVVECGLGARLDATRLVPAEVAVLTDVAMDHAQFLGTTLSAIAEEKAAVIRPGRPILSADQAPEVERVVSAHAEACEAPLIRLGAEISSTSSAQGHSFDLCGRTVEGVHLGLAGAHQVRNALLGAQAALLVAPEATDDAVRRGLAGVRWRGRFQRIDREGAPSVIVDGAHNAAAARALASALGDASLGPYHFVFAAMADKAVEGIFRALDPVMASALMTEVPSARAARAEDLVGHCQGSEAVADPAEALARASSRAALEGGTVVACGSLHLVGAFLALLGQTSGD